MTAARWALSPTDELAHAVSFAESDSAVLATRCGHELPAAAGLDTDPRGAVCAPCALMAVPLDLGGWDGPP